MKKLHHIFISKDKNATNTLLLLIPGLTFTLVLFSYFLITHSSYLFSYKFYLGERPKTLNVKGVSYGP